MAIAFVPGAAVAWASRARGFALVAIAPAISVTIIAISAIAAPLLGIGWSLIPVVGFTVLMTLIAYMVSSLLSRRAPDLNERIMPHRAWANTVAQVGAVVLAATLIGRRLVAALGEPESFSQTFDNVFHLNAIRYIEDTGSASSLTLNSMTGAGAGFYPAAWHDVVALVVSSTGASLPASVNVVNIVVASLVWPLGCIYLAHTVLGNRRAVSLVAGVLAAAFGAFPMSLLDFGVLYPNFLGNALLPIVLALSLQALGLSRQPSHFRTLDLLLLLAVLPGITLAHPSSTMALFALMVPALLYVWGRATLGIAGRQARRRWLALGAMAAILIAGSVVFFLLWKNVRPSAEAAFWPPVETTGRAIGEVISSSGIGRSVAWAVMVFAVLGLFRMILERNQLWVVGVYGVGAALFVVVASFPAGDLRTLVTGVWYNDPPRLAALLPLVTLPLATRGALELWDRWLLPWISRGIESIDRSSDVEGAGHPVRTASAALLRRNGLCLLATGALIGVLVVSTQGANVQEAQKSMADSYRLSENSGLISTDELALIQRLPDKVPEDATMIGNPWNGSSLAYALADRKVLQLHILSAVPEGAAGIINGLDAATTGPAICASVEQLQVQYVLDFGHREVQGRDHGYRGLDDLVASGMATLEDSQGEAKLYKIDSCGQ
ncbi:DUF6541 family protein [Arthrobacter pascens]|uniref:DUF6541 family protein n=1 Tax=Arthrobacter pascens TaxID=1677 RepID=UPI0027D833DB|nr:DUF6541 family protein [Arthrobacter pascens]